MKQELIIHKKDGVLTNKQVLVKAIQELKDGTYLLSIESRKKRTTNQNAYFHGPMLDIVYMGLKDAGFSEVRSKDDAKMIVKALFLKRSFVNEKTGEMIEYIQDTHKLTTIEMNELIEDVIRWGREYLGVTIGYPGEQVSMFSG